MWKLSAQVTGEVLITQYVLLRHGEARWWALRTKILFRFVSMISSMLYKRQALNLLG